MSDEAPKRDGIAEILASGRAPGVIMRGGRSQDFEIPFIPGVSTGSQDPKARKRNDLKIVAEARDAYMRGKAEHGSSKIPEGKLRHIGRVPIEAHVAMQKAYGDDYHGDGQHKLAKEAGFMWDS